MNKLSTDGNISYVVKRYYPPATTQIFHSYHKLYSHLLYLGQRPPKSKFKILRLTINITACINGVVYYLVLHNDDIVQGAEHCESKFEQYIINQLQTGT